MSKPSAPMQFRIGNKVVTFVSFGATKQTIKAVDQDGKMITANKNLFKPHTPDVPIIENERYTEAERLAELKRAWGAWR